MAVTVERKTGVTIEQILKRLQDSSITVGLHNDAGKYPDGGPKVTDVGLWNEFGTPTIPERSFLRSTFAENKKKYSDQFTKAYLEALRGGMNLRAAAGFIGNGVRDDIKRKIESIKTPPNASRTIAKKGFDDPLIDTKRMWGAVKWKFYYG